VFTLTVPSISATSGHNADGIIRGFISQSLFTGVVNNFEFSDELWAICRDTSTGSYIFLDRSTEAKSGVTDSFLPWGDDSTFSGTDSFYLASDNTVTEIRVTVTTPGVWVGTGLEVYDSTDGITANRLLGSIVDGTDGFRNPAGTYSITWATPGTPGVAFSPVPGDIASRPWVMVKPVGYVSKTTSPKLSFAFVFHSAASEPYTDKTAEYNEALTNGTFGSLPNVLYFVDANQIMTFPGIPTGMDLTVHRKVAASSRDGVMEYLADNNTWKTLTGANDPSNWFKNGPTTLGDPTQEFSVRWPTPADWTSKTLVLPLEVGGTLTLTGWHFRYRATSVAAIGPIAQPLIRARGRALGAGLAGGVYHYTGEGKTYHGVIFEAGVPSLSDVVIQVMNITTGLAAEFTVPSATLSSAALTPDHLDLSTPLVVNDGDSILITWVSGGSLQDVELVLQ
jgi:hypothetical protein